MKSFLAVLGVVVVGAAAYFIAKGNGPATTSGKTSSGGGSAPSGSAAQQVQKAVASNLLTSANMASLGGLLTSILPNGGAAKVAPAAGNGSGFVTEADLQASTRPATAPAVDASFTTEADLGG